MTCEKCKKPKQQKDYYTGLPVCKYCLRLWRSKKENKLFVVHSEQVRDGYDNLLVSPSKRKLLNHATNAFQSKTKTVVYKFVAYDDGAFYCGLGCQYHHGDILKQIQSTINECDTGVFIVEDGRISLISDRLLYEGRSPVSLI